MKKTVLVALMMAILLPLAGCGGHDNPPPPLLTTQILSDPVYDGDIFKDNLLPPAFTVTQGMTLNPPVQSVFAGIDSTPVTGGEYRAFLDFFLGGTAGVPLNAVIDSAFLDMFVTSNVAGSIPRTIDLVSFQPPTLQYTDFERAILGAWTFTTLNININQPNIAQKVTIDVTPLMAEAQRQGFQDFQVRILCGVGIIEIDDPTDPLVDRGQFAPLLQVSYF